MIYNLEERTKKFSKDVIYLIKTIKSERINENIISQLLRSSTSIGANYCEANNAVSKNDFKNKIYICKKELQETKYWLELFNETNPEKREELRMLWKETQELVLIFNKISSSLK